MLCLLWIKWLAVVLVVIIEKQAIKRKETDMHNQELLRAIEERHLVRSYLDKPIDAETLVVLQAEIDACNKEGELHLQLVTEEPAAFGGFMAKYGKFSGVRNYIACVGKKSSES